MTAIDRITDLAKMTREKRPWRKPGPPSAYLAGLDVAVPAERT
jgi:hypothetical protein